MYSHSKRIAQRNQDMKTSQQAQVTASLQQIWINLLRLCAQVTENTQRAHTKCISLGESDQISNSLSIGTETCIERKKFSILSFVHARCQMKICYFIEQTIHFIIDNCESRLENWTNRQIAIEWEREIENGNKSSSAAAATVDGIDIVILSSLTQLHQ